MARSGRLIFLAAAWCSSLAWAGARVRFVGVPEFLAAGETFALRVAYELPAGLTARLNVELKDTRHNVLQALHEEVKGKGTFEARFTAPGQFRRILLGAWVGSDWRRSLSPIIFTSPIAVLSPRAASKRRAVEGRQKAAAEAFLKRVGPLPADKYAIALLRDDKLPNHEPKLADELAEKALTPVLVGFNVRGPVILLGNPADNPLIAHLEKMRVLPHRPVADEFPGRGGGYIAWQRDFIGHGQESIALIAHGGSVSTLGLDGEGISQKPNAGAKLNQAPADPQAEELARKNCPPKRIVKLVAARGNLVAVAHWGGTLIVCDRARQAQFRQQMPQDITAMAWLGERLVVGLADGRVVALAAAQREWPQAATI